MGRLALPVALLFAGYAAGLTHAFVARWTRKKVYCPRCLHYLDWRDSLLKEIFPETEARQRRKEPW